MQTVIDFLSGIGDFFVGLGQFVVGLFEDIVLVVRLTGKLLLSIPDYFAWLPPSALALVVVIFGVVVVYKVLGRD